MDSNGLGLPDGVTLGTIGELPAVLVSTPACTAELVLQGAHLVRWQPNGQSPVLFISEHSRYRAGTAIRGGIPLCGPWFGPGRSGDRTPAHGFYRISPWRLVEASNTDDGTVTLALELTAADLSSDAGFWPADATLRYEVRLGSTLRLRLTTTAGAAGLDLEEALHTYFAVGDVRQAHVEGLAGAAYVDKTADGARLVQEGEVRLTAETDRVYARGGTTTIVDPVLARRIEIAGQGGKSTVVWNPWDEKASAMKDLGTDEWPGLLCVETANVLADAAVIPPDTAHTISAEISVHTL